LFRSSVCGGTEKILFHDALRPSEFDKMAVRARALCKLNEFVYGLRWLEIVQTELGFVGTIVKTIGCQVGDFRIHVPFSKFRVAW
jgi:hypothetical protein